MVYEVAVSDVKPGTKLKCDGGFSCLKEGTVHVVRQDEDGLFIRCACGHHYLDGQLTKRRTYTGLILAQLVDE